MSLGRRGAKPPSINRAFLGPSAKTRAQNAAERNAGRPAGWARLPAGLIDLTVGVVPMLVISLFVSSPDVSEVRDGRVISYPFSTVGYPLCVWMIYHTLMEASPWQATFGKKVMGLVVVDTDGRPVSLARSFFRNTAGRLFGALAWLIYRYAWVRRALMSSFTTEDVPLHDYVSGTRVRTARPNSELVAKAFV